MAKLQRSYAWNDKKKNVNLQQKSSLIPFQPYEQHDKCLLNISYHHRRDIW